MLLPASLEEASYCLVRQRCITAQKAKMSECLDKDRASMSSILPRLREHRGREDEKTVRAGGWGDCSELLLLDMAWLLRMWGHSTCNHPGPGMAAEHMKSQCMWSSRTQHGCCTREVTAHVITLDMAWLLSTWSHGACSHMHKIKLIRSSNLEDRGIPEAPPATSDQELLAVGDN